MGYWSSLNEDWFQRRLAAILNNEATPMSATEWRDNLKFSRKLTRRFLAAVEQYSASKL